MKWFIIWSCLTTACLCAVMKNVEHNTFNIWDLDLEKGNPCGGTITLKVDESLMKVQSSEQKYQTCDVRFFIPNTGRCRQVCVSVEKVDKPDIVTIQARQDKMSEPKQLSENDRYCVDKMEMYVKVERTGSMAGKNSLNYTVGAICPGVSENIVKQADNDSMKIKDDGKMEAVRISNYIKGIVTGVCLALVFLIILLITYCYYKNSSFRGTRDYPAPKSGPSLAGFKAKLHINKEGKQKEKEPPRAEYRAKASSPEHKPLLAGAAATGTADIALTEIGEKDEKKAPEIVVSGDSGDGGNTGGNNDD